MSYMHCTDAGGTTSNFLQLDGRELPLNYQAAQVAEQVCPM